MICLIKVEVHTDIAFVNELQKDVRRLIPLTFGDFLSSGSGRRCLGTPAYCLEPCTVRSSSLQSNEHTETQGALLPILLGLPFESVEFVQPWSIVNLEERGRKSMVKKVARGN